MRISIIAPWGPPETRLRFFEVEPGTCYRSGQPRPKDLPYLLNKYKLRSFVVAKAKVNDYETRFAELKGINILHLKFKRDFLRFKHIIPPEKNIAEFIESAKYMRRNMQPFIIHCRRGKDRTGLLVALYRIEAQGWHPQLAWEEMRYFGHAAFVNGNSYFKKWLEARYNIKLA